MIVPELISVVAIAFVALIAGMLLNWLRQPPLVGYILAGVALGPSGAGLIEDREDIAFFAELGVLLLLFFVGMELSLRGFRAVWLTATLTVIGQILIAVVIMWSVSDVMGWSTAAAVLFGFVVAVSSTAVVIEMLRNLNILQTRVGQLTAAILIAQDLAIVPMLLIIGTFAGDGITTGFLAKIGISILLFGAGVWYLGQRQKVSLPLSSVLVRSTTLRPLYGLVLCLGAALATGALGLTAAFGAFLAGLLVGNSTARRTIMRSIKPVQEILMMVFFVSVGLLIDLAHVWTNLEQVAFIIFIVIVVKTVVNVGLLLALREPWLHAFFPGVLLAQVGEFSFVIGAAGMSAGLIGSEEFNLIVTVAAFSLVISPLWLVTARRVLRIALTRAQTFDEVISNLRAGGFRAIWRAAKSRTMPMPLARRVLGRPKRRSSALAARAPDASDDPNSENEGSAETKREHTH